MQAQRQKPVTGAEGLVGEQGRALSEISADGVGQVTVHGEIWRAISSQPIPSGARVRVVAIHGLTLTVAPVD
jgi:membrane-bound serine protease (ClpP class)